MLSMAKALSPHFRVKVIGFGVHTLQFFKDDVEVVILRNPLRVSINRGLFGYVLNAMTSGARLVLALMRGEVPRNSIVHLSFGAQFTVVYFMSRLLRIHRSSCYVFSLRSPRWMDLKLLPAWQKFLAAITEVFAIRKSELTTFESEVIRKNVTKYWKFMPKSMLLPVGVDTSLFQSNYEGSASSVILYAARIKKQKDQMSVVRAISAVVGQVPEVRLLLVGSPEEPDYYHQVKAEISRLGLEGVVQLVDNVDIGTLNKLRCSAAVNVIYSTYTGFDVAVAETMALGVPIIFSDIPSLKGIAEDQVNCVLVPPMNPLMLSYSLVDLMKNPNKRVSLAIAARKTAEQKLSWDVLAERLAMAVQSQCSGRRKAPFDPVVTFRTPFES